MRKINYVAIDIETVAGDNTAVYYQSKKYTAPANYKDQAKIDAYILERRLDDQRQAALYWWTGKIVCVSLKTLAPRSDNPGGLSVVGEDEKALLTTLFRFLAGDSTFVPIGKSSEWFDVPYIIGRALHHDLGVPECLRPFRPITDVDQIFGFSQAAGQRSNLSDYAFGLGIKGKLGHGQNVQTWYQEALLGNRESWAKIRTYCEGDVDIVVEMLRRWQRPFDSAEPTRSSDLEIPFGKPETY